MDAVAKKLKRILTKEFPSPARVDLDDNDDGIIGTIVSSRFKGVDTMDRVNAIWDLLDAELIPEERRRVVLILAMTPLEEKLHADTGPDDLRPLNAKGRTKRVSVEKD